MITSGKMGWVCPVCGAGNNPKNTLCGASCHAAAINTQSISSGIEQKYDPMKVAYKGQEAGLDGGQSINGIEPLSRAQQEQEERTAFYRQQVCGDKDKRPY